MPWSIDIVLALPWALGLATSFALGGFVRVLAVPAVALLLVRLMNVRRTSR